jgi:myo-inositol 2-dehydrogenase/D-chiro-inositol 1-dehydrogenase
VVSDPVPSRARDVAERLGAETASTPGALLASGVDGVVIAAATEAHPELILRWVTAGLPTFCEKPVARTSAEAALLGRQVAGTGVEIQIGYPRRFDAAFASRQLT